jgi:hypothetical protein
MSLRLLRIRRLGVPLLSEPLLRVVVLHGKGNNGANYRNRLTPLIDALAKQKDINGSHMSLSFVYLASFTYIALCRRAVEWIFPTAPYELPVDRTRLNTEPRPQREPGLGMWPLLSLNSMCNMLCWDLRYTHLLNLNIPAKTTTAPYYRSRVCVVDVTWWRSVLWSW